MRQRRKGVAIFGKSYPIFPAMQAEKLKVSHPFRCITLPIECIAPQPAKPLLSVEDT